MNDGLRMTASESDCFARRRETTRWLQIHRSSDLVSGKVSAMLAEALDIPPVGPILQVERHGNLNSENFESLWYKNFSDSFRASSNICERPSLSVVWSVEPTTQRILFWHLSLLWLATWMFVKVQCNFSTAVPEMVGIKNSHELILTSPYISRAKLAIKNYFYCQITAFFMNKIVLRRTG